MKKIILTQLLIFIAISFAFASTSKNKFQQGYIVTNQLDTLWGSIVLKVEKVNAVQCQFKANQSDSVTTYLPYEIKSYRLLESGNLYVSEQITLKGEQQKSVFLDFLQQGEVELYLYVNAADNKEYFFVRRQGDKLILLEQNITSFEYSNRYDNRYIGQLTYLLSDAPSLKNDIDKTKLSSNSLKNLLSKYEMLKSGSSPIVFASSKKNKIVTDLSVSAGATYITAQLPRRYITDEIIKVGDWSPLVRLGLNLRYPRLNDSFGLTLGLDLAQFSKQWKNEDLWNLTYKTFLINPQIGLHYIYTKSIVRPVIEAGLNLSAAVGTEGYVTCDWYPPFRDNNYFTTDRDVALNIGFFVLTGADFMVTPKYSINLRIGYSKSYGIYSRENMQMCQVLLGFGF